MSLQTYVSRSTKQSIDSGRAGAIAVNKCHYMTNLSGFNNIVHQYMLIARTNSSPCWLLSQSGTGIDDSAAATGNYRLCFEIQVNSIFIVPVLDVGGVLSVRFNRR
jgi:hypothetical protein